jgi:excinuclease ABC subunit A
VGACSQEFEVAGDELARWDRIQHLCIEVRFRAKELRDGRCWLNLRASMVHPNHLPNSQGFIEIRGARQNNLKGFDVSLPLGRLIVVSGPSGCGKSSFAFDTLYAEGQRRYVETFSPYTRQFFERMDKPSVDEIRGIPPAIAIEQVNAVKSTRSTVGTITDINDYLKLLLPRVVDAYCPGCQQVVRPATAVSVVAELLQSSEPLLIAFPLPVPVDAVPGDFMAFLQQQGYQRVWAGGVVMRTDEQPQALPSAVFVIQDRLTPNAENKARLAEAVEVALRFGKGKVAAIEGERVRKFVTGWHCASCDQSIPEPTPGRFSFNHPQGACPACKGFGRVITLDILKALPNRDLSLEDGVVKPFQTEGGADCQRDLIRFAKERGISVTKSFNALSEADQQWVLYGSNPKLSSDTLWKKGEWYGVRGFFEWMEAKSYKMHVRVLLSRYRTYTVCGSCNGNRFASDTMSFRWDGCTVSDLMRLPVNELHEFIRVRREQLARDSTADLLVDEVQSRLQYLLDVGLGYLSLDRPTKTLSGGETARVNLTTCLGTALVNTLFVLDEPSIGLHPRDTGRLLSVLKRLRDKGNTLVVVEHEEAVLRAADHFVEIGPGRGDEGGHLVYAGPAETLLNGKTRTLTADYLTGKKAVPVRTQRRRAKGWVRLEGASAHNLKEVNVVFPLGVLCCVTGVSGSGKSTLVHHVLYAQLAKAQELPLEEDAGECRAIHGLETAGSVVLVDQTPLSKTPRSTPALYLGMFDEIRAKFAATTEAQAAGFTAGTFSFNSGKGRCERCGGSGFEKIEMQFLSDVFVRCPECDGRRYQAQVRQILLEGKSIDEVLDLTVTEAIAYAKMVGLPAALKPLEALEELGLGYLRLGQPLNTLSGGEAQRIKLAERLIQRSKAGAFLILDEPTTGLHLDDIALLVKALNRLVDDGHTVLVIEHNVDVIRGADHVIDLGPESGVDGGRLVVAGTPEEVAACAESHTGRFLRANGVSEAALTVAEHPDAQGFEADSGGIQIVGARQHNLKNLTLPIPRGAMVVITGLSGSGKSSLAFDLLFAEGQRRFLDSMSPYARQFATQLERPDVDRIAGLPPSVAIEQRLTRGGGKSTVATVTEVYHFLRLLFAKLGVQHCADCGIAVERQTVAAVVAHAEGLAKTGVVSVLAPLVRARKGYHNDIALWASRNGYEDLLIDDRWFKLKDFPKLERFKEHTIEVLVGKIRDLMELRKIIETALEIGKGTAVLLDAKNTRQVLSTEFSCTNCGTSFEELDPRQFSFNSPHGWCEECHGFGEEWARKDNPRLDSALEIELDHERQHEAIEDGEGVICTACHGARIRRTSRHVVLGGGTLPALVARPAASVLEWLAELKFSGNQAVIAEDIIPEIVQRLKFLDEVGLDYLALNRSAKTLSGGESQRIRLAAQLGSNLRGVLYVLDEPTIGLHPRDNAALLDTLAALKAKGNSLVIVEHDEDTLLRADHVIDLGPGAGRHGGEVIAQGTLADLRASALSATGACLRNPLKHPTLGIRRSLADGKLPGWLELKGATLNNIREMDVRIPLGRLTVLTGISGSGKSTLMRGILKPVLEAAIASRKKRACDVVLSDKLCRSIVGTEGIEAVYEVDQSPIGKTSRSTPVTYLGIFDTIRSLFASTPLARIRGYGGGRFSFNTEGGRCETCTGQGTLKIEMNFLPTAHIQCPDCGGRRYNPTTLEVPYNGKNIADVLALPMEEGAEFFASHPSIARPLNLLCQTGLGYLTLGQPSQTLSGGEAQRLKLVGELARGVGRTENARLRSSKPTPSMVYLLEEPTIGLHQADVRQLLGVLHRLVDAGHTVVVIEHHTSVIAEADYLFEIGPEAGARGGQIIASGTPEEVLKVKGSRIAPFLKPLLKGPTKRTTRAVKTERQS